MSTDVLLTNKSSSGIIYELKEKAKWSDDRQEKKTAIKQLSAYGSDALSALEEVFNVTAYDEIRVACVDAINTIKRAASKTEAAAETQTTTETTLTKSESMKEARNF
ncbi:MAG: hypothetical protein QXX64_05250 [Nitrososphaera sp.]|uniref:Uncharacterized protein n=1 Tax=Nitrososphaera gargensis (strain Ga9.2) TaxID=1237085 RepID=K0IDI5_NITGG|nr:hypothetical protein [Candidatus Nitrososphaera gargensis]AFU57715.1 hypothetical protein Ngar_c07730 [Candidatus Nitrososphaera gargensis Ga9.2]